MMKNTIYSLVAAFFMIFAASCSTTPRSYDDLSDMKGVKMTYIGPSMMKMASSMVNVAGVGDLLKLSDNITSLRIVTVSRTSHVKRVRPFIKNEIKRMGAVPMIDVKKAGNEQSAVYIVPDSNDPEYITAVIVVQDHTTDLVAVTATGRFTPAQISSIYK